MHLRFFVTFAFTCSPIGGVGDALNLLQMAAHRKIAPQERCQNNYEDLSNLSAPETSESDNRAAGAVPNETHNLKFETIVHNDVVGDGIIFAGVTTLGGEVVDAVVTAENYRAAVPSKTGLRGKMMNINLDGNTSATFTLKFVDSKTKKEVELGEFLFSVLDLDVGLPQLLEAKETLTIGGWKDYFLLPADKGGQVKVVHLGKGVASFSGSERGSEEDNPYDPMVLDTVQAERAVTFRFPKGKSSITWKYEVTKTIKEGRNFQFAGMTNLYFCKAPKVDIDFSFAKVVRSNLGNQGPDFHEIEGVRYHNIASVNGQIIDMEINALDDYQCTNCQKNGVNGVFGQVNLGAPLKAKHTQQMRNENGKAMRPFAGTTEFKFTLFKNGTDEVYRPDWLYFSMFDLDNGNNKSCPPKYQESFTVSHFSKFDLAPDTTIKTQKLSDSMYKFSSSFKAGGENNPEDPLDLNETSLPHAITFVFRNTATWKVRFAVGGPNKSPLQGRNFLFAGKSSTAPCGKDSWDDVINVESDEIDLGSPIEDPGECFAGKIDFSSKDNCVACIQACCFRPCHDMDKQLDITFEPAIAWYDTCRRCDEFCVAENQVKD